MLDIEYIPLPANKKDRQKPTRKYSVKRHSISQGWGGGHAFMS